MDQYGLVKCINPHHFLADVEARKAELGIVDRDPDEGWQETVAREVRKLERLAELAEAGVITDISVLGRYERRRPLCGPSFVQAHEGKDGSRKV